MDFASCMTERPPPLCPRCHETAGVEVVREVQVVTRRSGGWRSRRKVADAICRDTAVPRDPNDALTFGVVGAALAIVTLVATVSPGSRAVRVDPMRALRGD